MKVNATHFEEIAPYPKDADDKYDVHVIIETPRNIRHKYALDDKLGIFKLKQTIAQGLQWPYDYGFVPQTLAPDGDPIDALFLCDEPTFTGCLVQARLVGVIRLSKNGEENDRLITCAQRMDGIAQTTDKYDDADDIPKEVMDSVCRFLIEYSEKQGNTIDFKGVVSRKKARQAIEQTHKAFKKRKK